VQDETEDEVHLITTNALRMILHRVAPSMGRGHVASRVKLLVERHNNVLLLFCKVGEHSSPSNIVFRIWHPKDHMKDRVISAAAWAGLPELYIPNALTSIEFNHFCEDGSFIMSV